MENGTFGDHSRRASTVKCSGPTPWFSPSSEMCQKVVTSLFLFITTEIFLFIKQKFLPNGHFL